MTTVSKLMLGAVIAAVSIASPALAQYAAQSDSAHHSKYLKKNSQRTGADAFASEPRGADPGAKPYHYGGGSGS
ncbi:MAG: hypothetical protein WAN27_20765 [Xanthobacteraceae bacterium]|jgi:hypothetical protein